MPRQPDEIRMLQIDDKDLLSCNVANFERLFSKEKLLPSKAKQLWGSVALTTERCDKDPRPNWRIPEWRRYMARLFERLPHFSYFLLAVKEIYAGVVLALLAEEHLLIVNQDAVSPDRGALVYKLVSLLEPVVAYCKEIFDEPEQV